MDSGIASDYKYGFSKPSAVILNLFQDLFRL